MILKVEPDDSVRNQGSATNSTLDFTDLVLSVHRNPISFTRGGVHRGLSRTSSLGSTYSAADVSGTARINGVMVGMVHAGVLTASLILTREKISHQNPEGRSKKPSQVKDARGSCLRRDSGDRARNRNYRCWIEWRWSRTA